MNLNALKFGFLLKINNVPYLANQGMEYFESKLHQTTAKLAVRQESYIPVFMKLNSPEE